MQEPYDTSLMKRGEVARRHISGGEDPYRMLAAVVWPGRDWHEEVLQARLVGCPGCLGEVPCEECGNAGVAA